MLINDIRFHHIKFYQHIDSNFRVMRLQGDRQKIVIAECLKFVFICILIKKYVLIIIINNIFNDINSV